MCLYLFAFTVFYRTVCDHSKEVAKTFICKRVSIVPEQIYMYLNAIRKIDTEEGFQDLTSFTTIYSRSLWELMTTVHQRKPTQKCSICIL